MTPPHDPQECERAFQAFLDGEGQWDAGDCLRCQELEKQARWLAAQFPGAVKSCDLGRVERIYAEVRRDQRFEPRRRVATVLALCASALLTVGVVASGVRSPRRTPTEIVTVTPTRPEILPTPRVADPFDDARTTIVAVTQRAGERAAALAPVRFLPTAERPETSANATVSVPNVASSTLEPLTGTTRRAVNLFVRDFRSLAALPPSPEMR